MSDRLDIAFNKSEGALLRLIGLVERKGYEIRALSLGEASQDEPASMSVTIVPRDETRNVEVLKRHIEKMHDVSEVQIRTASRILESAS